MIKKTELLDMADINIVEAKIPYPTDKVGFRMNCTILPYYCFLLKMIVEISERAVERQYFLYAIAGSAILLLIAKLGASFIQYKLSEDSVSAKNFAKEAAAAAANNSANNSNSQTTGPTIQYLNVPNGKQTNGDITHFKQD